MIECLLRLLGYSVTEEWFIESTGTGERWHLWAIDIESREEAEEFMQEAIDEDPHRSYRMSRTLNATRVMTTRLEKD